MSVNSLANAAAARRPDLAPLDNVPRSYAEIAAASSISPGEQASGAKGANGITTAFNVLFGYIPTEIVTLYVAVVAALQPQRSTTLDDNNNSFWMSSGWIAFSCFAIATPLVVWIAYASKLKAAGKPVPAAYAAWPLWEMMASLIAYCAWAFALPGSPFRHFERWYSPGLASIAVLVVSTALGLLAPMFQNRLAEA